MKIRAAKYADKLLKLCWKRGKGLGHCPGVLETDGYTTDALVTRLEIGADGMGNYEGGRREDDSRGGE